MVLLRVFLLMYFVMCSEDRRSDLSSGETLFLKMATIPNPSHSQKLEFIYAKYFYSYKNVQFQDVFL